MGLDSYFGSENAETKRIDALQDDRLKDISLCGGMLSGNGPDGSFRGKVYASFIEKVTDNAVSLYTECLTPDEYFPVIAGIEQWLGENKGDFTPRENGWGAFPFTRQEADDLLTLFRVAHERGANLYGWW